MIVLPSDAIHNGIELLGLASNSQSQRSSQQASVVGIGCNRRSLRICTVNSLFESLTSAILFFKRAEPCWQSAYVHVVSAHFLESSFS